MDRWKYNTKEIEDFVNFVVGFAWVTMIMFVGVGVGLMALKALGVIVVK